MGKFSWYTIFLLHSIIQNTYLFITLTNIFFLSVLFNIKQQKLYKFCVDFSSFSMGYYKKNYIHILFKLYNFSVLAKRKFKGKKEIFLLHYSECVVWLRNIIKISTYFALKVFLSKWDFFWDEQRLFLAGLF